MTRFGISQHVELTLGSELTAVFLVRVLVRGELETWTHDAHRAGATSAGSARSERWCPCSPGSEVNRGGPRVYRDFVIPCGLVRVGAVPFRGQGLRS